MSDMIHNLKENKKILYIGIGVIAIIILLIIIIALFVQNRTKTISYTDLENQLVSATKKYLQDHPAELPTMTNNTIVIDATDLESGEYIKDIQKLVNDTSCSALIQVSYLAENDYHFRPELLCADYQTREIYYKIMDDNPIIPEGEGLYSLNGDYVFRGENPNNYLSFAGHMWRIVKIINGNLYVIYESGLDSASYAWDDRYNVESENSKGLNDYNLSRIKESTLNIYNSSYKGYEQFLIPFETCIGNRDINDVNNSGTIECSIITESLYVGNLALYDFLNASTDPNCFSANDKSCQNYNYLALAKTRWWTSTPSNKNTYTVYSIKNNGVVSEETASGKRALRPTLLISGETLFNSGDGSASNPYTLK